MDILKYRPPFAESFRAKTIAAGLAFAGVAAACGGQVSGLSYQARILGEIRGTTPLTEGDQKVQNVIVDGDELHHDEQLAANDGVNVRTFPGIDGRVIGIVEAGTIIENAVRTSGDGGPWIAAECREVPMSEIYPERLPKDTEGRPTLPNNCFISGNYISGA